MITGNFDGIARLWDVESGSLLQRFVGHSRGIRSVFFSPDGRKVLTLGADSTVRLWDVDSGKELHRLGDSGSAAKITSIAFSPDGQRVLVGIEDPTARSLHTARLWDVETGKEVQQFEQHFEWTFTPRPSMAISQDGGRVLIVDGTLGAETARIWDVETGKELQHWQSDFMDNAVFSPDGRRVITVANHTAQLWDVDSGKEVQRLVGHSSWIDSVAFSADGRWVLTGSDDNMTKVWDASSGRDLASLISFTGGGWAVVDPAGHYDASDPDNSQTLYWVTDNLHTIDLGQLKKDYYTPGLLARVLRGEHLPDVTGMDIVTLPPVLTVIGNYNPTTKRIQIGIHNDGGGVGKLLMKVNDRLLRTIDHPGLPVEERV